VVVLDLSDTCWLVLLARRQSLRRRLGVVRFDAFERTGDVINDRVMARCGALGRIDALRLVARDGVNYQ
jgi:hypothetical protein